MQKAALVIESKKEQTVTVQAGWYSEKAMAEDLGWSSCLWMHYMVQHGIS